MTDDHRDIVVKRNRNPPGPTVHLPDPDDPDMPRCHFAEKYPDATWNTATTREYPGYEVCKYCTGDAKTGEGPVNFGYYRAAVAAGKEDG